MIHCIFCRIASGELPANIVYKNEYVTAFTDLHPQAPTHILVITNKHIGSVDAIADDETANVAAQCLRAAREIARAQNLAGGYRVVANTGADAGQTVPHLHFHLLAGRPLLWPPG